MHLSRIIAFTAVFAVAFSAAAQSELPYELQRVLGQHTEMYGGGGGRNALLSSVSVEGSITQGGETMAFQMHRKRPDSFRYRLSLNGNSVTSGFDGRTGWVRSDTAGEVTIERVSGSVLRGIEEQGRFESPLFNHQLKPEYQYKLLPGRAVDGRSVHVVEVSGRGSEVFQYFLDTNSAYIVRIDRLDAAGEVVSQTLFRDYRMVEGFPFAYEVESRSGGETFSVAKIDSISVNPGLLSFVFRVPTY